MLIMALVNLLFMRINSAQLSVWVQLHSCACVCVCACVRDSLSCHTSLNTRVSERKQSFRTKLEFS